MKRFLSTLFAGTIAFSVLNIQVTDPQTGSVEQTISRTVPTEKTLSLARLSLRKRKMVLGDQSNPEQKVLQKAPRTRGGVWMQ